MPSLIRLARGSLALFMMSYSIQRCAEFHMLGYCSGVSLTVFRPCNVPQTLNDMDGTFTQAQHSLNTVDL